MKIYYREHPPRYKITTVHISFDSVEDLQKFITFLEFLSVEFFWFGSPFTWNQVREAMWKELFIDKTPEVQWALELWQSK